MCANHTHFHTPVLKATCKYKFGGLYSPSCEYVSQNPVVFFAKRPCKEPARMLFAGNFLISKLGWYIVGLCWLDIPASHRRWPLGTFWWPIELTLLCCLSFLVSSRTFSLSIATVLKFTSCIETYKVLQFAILPSGLSGGFSELLGVMERLSFTPLWNLTGPLRGGAVLWN